MNGRLLTERKATCSGRCLRKTPCTFDAQLKAPDFDEEGRMYSPLCFCAIHEGHGSQYGASQSGCCSPMPCKNWDLCKQCYPQHILDSNNGLCDECIPVFGGECPEGIFNPEPSRCQECGKDDTATVKIVPCSHIICVHCLRFCNLRFSENFDFRDEWCTMCMALKYCEDDDLD